MSIFFIAIKHIINRKRTAVSAALGVALSFVLLVISSAIFNGFHQNLVEGATAYSSHVEIFHPFTTIPDYETLSNEIQSIENVKSVHPTSEEFAIIKHNSNSGLFFEGILLRGISFKHNVSSPLKNMIKDGDFILKDSNIVLGLGVAKQIDAKVGDSTSITLTNQVSKNFLISGIIDFGLEDLNNRGAYLSLDNLQKITKKEKLADKLLVNLYDFKKTNDTIIQINNITNLSTRSWLDINRNFLNNIALQKIVSNILFMLILVISGFTITIILGSSVREKQKDIGILRAYGVSKLSILKIFLTIGILLGFFGLITGTLLSYIIYRLINSKLFYFTADVYDMPKVPFLINRTDIYFILLLITTVIFISSLYPALKASNLLPVEAIRED